MTDPLFYQGDNRLMILIHGFMGAPYNFHYMVHYFKKRGYSIWTPRLMGHNQGMVAFEQALPFEWYESLKTDILNKLKRHHFKEIHLVGLSMGGAFALRLSVELKQMGIMINRLVLLATPYRLKFHQQLLLMLVHSKLFYRFHPYKQKRASDISLHLQREINTQYNTVPIRSVFGLSYFLKENRPFIPQVSTPILIIHSKRDHTIPYHQSHYFYTQITTSQKQLLTLENSFHILPLDLERDTIFQEIEHFLMNKQVNHSV